MERKALEFIHRHQMVHAGDRVIVALSGGADSVALFHLLYTHRENLGIALMAAHFEHGIRGEESRRDEAFVTTLCETHGVALFVEHGEMAVKPRPSHQSEEAFARRLRYGFFERLAGEHNALVATAHTLSDNAETVLFRMARGTGPRGLGGIPPVRPPYIRPLLTVSRAEVEAYCAANGLAYVTDSTNLEEDYARNRLRNGLLPQLEQAHPGAAKAVARLAADMREMDAWLTAQAQALLEEAANGSGYNAETLLAAPGPLRLQALSLLAGPDADRAKLAGLERVLAGELGALQLDAGRVARRRRGSLNFDRPFDKNRVESWRRPLAIGLLTLPGGYTLRVWIVKNSGGDRFDKKRGEKDYLFAADYAKIWECGEFRNRRPGDRFAPAGRGVTKTLKSWMNEQGLGEGLRYRLPLLADKNDPGRVLWVWGAGFAEEVRPGPDTRQWLFIQCEQGPDGI